MNMVAIKLAALIALAMLAGCQVAPVAPSPVAEYKTKIVDTACTWTRIITVSKQDVLTDGTTKQILAHDRAWTANCGR